MYQHFHQPQDLVLATDHRDDRRRLQADRVEERPELARERVECFLAIADEIHLVDHDGDLTHAEHREQIGVTPCVLLDPFAGVEHEQRRLRPRGARHHVLQELDVARRVEDEIAALRRAEEHARRVDRDPLRPLVLERVEQERVLERLRGAGAEILDLLQLPVRQRAGVGEQAPDDRALSVIDVADDHDPHASLDLGRTADVGGGVRREILGEGEPLLVEPERADRRARGTGDRAHYGDSPR